MEQKYEEIWQSDKKRLTLQSLRKIAARSNGSR